MRITAGANEACGAAADALLPLITRERGRAARAALEAAGNACDGENNRPGRSDWESGYGFACGACEGAVKALSPSDIVKGMK